MKERNQKNGYFLLHGGILAVASILVRLIGMLYRIPMVNIIGSEGSGYYANAYSVYNILLLLSSYSLPLAVSKIVSAAISKRKWKEAKKVLITSLAFSAFSGTVFALITFFGADFFCGTVLKSPNSAYALKWLAPTIFIVAFLGVLRGFFQGHENMIPTAISQIIEQIVNACMSVGMAAVLFHAGIEQAAMAGNASLPASFGAGGGTIGTGAGALAALALMIGFIAAYWKTLEKRAGRDRSKTVPSYGRLLHVLVVTAVPIIFSTAVYNSVDIIDAALFNHAMAARGIEETAYSAVWGDYNNAFLLLVHLPVALSSAVASALVPSLAAAYARHDRNQVLSKISLAMTVTLLFSIPFAFGEMAVGGNLANLLFSKLGEAAPKYLTVGGLAVITFSLATVTNAILQGLNHMQRPVLHALAALVLHVLLMVILLFLFKADVYAVIVSYIVFGAAVSGLNLFAIYRLTGYTVKPVKGALLPAGAAFLMVLICLLIAFLVSRGMTGKLADLLILFLSVLFGGGVYLVLIFLTGCITKRQILDLPKGEKIASFLTKLKLLR